MTNTQAPNNYNYGNQNPWQRPASAEQPYQQPQVYQYPVADYAPQQYPAAGQVAPQVLYGRPAPAPQSTKGNFLSRHRNGVIIGAIGSVAASILIPVGVANMNSNFDAADKAEDSTSQEHGTAPAETDAERSKEANRLLDAKSTDPKYPNMTVREAAYHRLQDSTVEHDQSALPGYVAPSYDNTPNQANMLQQVAIAAATYENDPRLLDAAFTADNPTRSSVEAEINAKSNMSQDARFDTSFKITYVGNDASHTQSAGHDVPMATPISTTQKLGSIDPEGVPTRIALQLDAHDSEKYWESVQVFVDGNWLQKEDISPSDPAKWIPPQNLVDILG